MLLQLDSNSALIIILGKVVLTTGVEYMENVFAEQTQEVITSSSVEEPIFMKPKRSAFVFITAESEASQTALQDLKTIEEVKEVYLARGAYDIVARVSGESFDQVREVVGKRIRNLSSIKSTLTLTVI